MSGKPFRKPGPVPFTQEDIDALAGGNRPSTVTRRLKEVRSPAAPRGRRARRTDNPGPPLLKRGELASLRAGRPSPAVRKRLFKASEAASATADVEDAKPYPSQQPPSQPRKR
jgi:hypothetical protein